jgi:NitT/TauT family transport system substrate-binding protein
MKSISGTVGVGFLALVTFLGVSAAAADLEVLTLGTAPSLTAVLEIVADDQGFFAAEGLQVVIRDFPSGKEALDEVVAGRLDVAASTALPVVAMAFGRTDFRIIGTVGDLADDNMVVARRDRGIRQVTDLKAKKVGTTAAIMPHYVLDLLLRQHGLDSNTVDITFAPQAELAEALGQGQLDGAALLGKYLAQARRDLGTNAITFSDKALFELKTYVMVRDTLVRQRPQAVVKFLRGCLKAEQFVAKHPDQSMAIVARRLRLDPVNVRQAWPNCHFAVEFHQAMLNDLEGKARWHLERGLSTAKRIPNYLDLLYYHALDQVAPQRVTIIR